MISNVHFIKKYSKSMHRMEEKTQMEVDTDLVEHESKID